MTSTRLPHLAARLIVHSHHAHTHHALRSLPLCASRWALSSHPAQRCFHLSQHRATASSDATTPPPSLATFTQPAPPAANPSPSSSASSPLIDTISPAPPATSSTALPPAPTTTSSSSTATSSSSAALSYPFRVAVIGSGPAAFYTCKYLLRSLPACTIDLLERLPVPFGLVRFGVAPDHPEVKQVVNDFTSLLTDRTAASGQARVRFYGNVSVGVHTTVKELQQHYHIIVVCTGAQSDARLDIPGGATTTAGSEQPLLGVHSARAFVNWYNGLPTQHSTTTTTSTSAHPTFSPPLGRHAVIIGQGNVALDCARLLLSSSSPNSPLHSTDITPHALHTLSQSCIQHVTLLARRGPIQSAFTTAEFRELVSMPDITVCIPQRDMQEAMNNPSSMAELAQRPIKRKWELIQTTAAKAASSASSSPPSFTNTTTDSTASSASCSSTSPPPTTTTKTLTLRYFSQPLRYLPSPTAPDHVGFVQFERQRLSGPAHQQRAQGTGEVCTLPADLVLESIGYRSVPLEPTHTPPAEPLDATRLPFDATAHVIPAVQGRTSVKAVYVSGWVKRGPTGIIGTNIGDARETVQSIVEDVQGGLIAAEPTAAGDTAIAVLQQGHHRVVTTDGWLRIDSEEKRRGEQAGGKSRIKITDWQELLHIAQA